MLALIDIIDYTLGSLNEYTRSSIHKIANMLIEDGIATQKNNEENKLFIGNLSRLESIEYCLRNNQITLKCIEKWEFDKNYKYSMLFDIDNITNQMFQGCINLKQIIPYNTLTNFEELYSVAHNPSFLQQKDKYLLKFNLGLESTDFSGNKLKRRYTILAIFYSIEKVLELRFDSLGDVFVSNYIRYVYEVLEWIRKFLNISIKACNLKDIVDHIKVNGEKNGVVLSGQDMLMATGGKATIEVGKNDKMILPFIGELKILMENYKEEFEQVPVLKQAFQDFIFEKENLSEFPWVRFKFKENNFEVKFIFDYGQEKGCLLHHFSSSLKANQGRGRMDYVTNYIIRVRNIINKLPLTNDEIKKFENTFRHYSVGNWVYPGVIYRITKIPIKKIYETLNIMQKAGWLESYFEIYCLNCKEPVDIVYSSINDITSQYFCENCGYIGKSYQDAVLIFKVIKDG